MIEKFHELLANPIENAATNLEDAERQRMKMINILIHNYLDTHMQQAHQVGFLTGLKTYQTYLIKLEFDRTKKAEYSKLRDNLRLFLE